MLLLCFAEPFSCICLVPCLPQGDTINKWHWFSQRGLSPSLQGGFGVECSHSGPTEKAMHPAQHHHHASLAAGLSTHLVHVSAPFNLPGSAQGYKALCRASCNSPCSEISAGRWQAEDYPCYMAVIIKSICCTGEMEQQPVARCRSVWRVILSSSPIPAKDPFLISGTTVSLVAFRHCCCFAQFSLSPWLPFSW